MHDPHEASRRKTVDFLKKFRDRRRRTDGDDGRTDLQLLRGRLVPAYVILAACLVLILLIEVSEWPLWLYITAAVSFIAGMIFIKLSNGKIEAAIRLFDECAPQEAGHLLQLLGEPVPEARQNVVGFIEKFSKKRRNFDASSPHTDLEALRSVDMVSIYCCFFFFSMWVTRGLPGWVIAGGLPVLLMWLAYDLVHQRKVKAALGIFDEFTPQSVDELLALMEDDGKERARSVAAMASV